jgi:protein SCO1/2
VIAGALRRSWPLIAAAVVLAAAAAAARALVSSSRGPAAGEAVLERLEVYGEVPDFSLVERSGRAIGRAELLGKVWLASFIYTKCTETCPTQSLEIARLQAEFAGAPDLRLVSITVDPERDTPAVLAEYAARYSAHSERWLFLTGDKRQIYCLATQGFRLGVVDPDDRSPPACGGQAAQRVWRAVLALVAPSPALAAHGSTGLVMHSARVVLVDRAARVRAYHLATDEGSMQRLRPNLRRLLAERPPGRG